jgi:hypothetical protein
LSFDVMVTPVVCKAAAGASAAADSGKHHRRGVRRPP